MKTKENKRKLRKTKGKLAAVVVVVVVVVQFSSTRRFFAALWLTGSLVAGTCNRSSKLIDLDS